MNVNAKHLEKYNAVLEDFAQRGNRFATQHKLAWWAKFIGMPLNELLDVVHERGINNRDSDLTRLYNGTTINRNWQPSNYHHVITPVRQPPKVYPQYIRDLIAENATVVNAGDLMALSPYPVAHLHGIDATKIMLQTLFADDELILIGTMKNGVKPENLRPLKDWFSDKSLSEYEQVKINTFSGNFEEGGKSGKTLIGEKCLNTFRYLLLEYDDLTALDQCKIAVGMINRGYEVVAIVFSGNKSLHILLNVNAENRDKWNATADKIKRLFCGCDCQALRPSIAIRLGGARRSDKATEQRLLYLNPKYGFQYGNDDTVDNTVIMPQKQSATNGDNVTVATAQTQPRANMTGYKYSCSDCQIKGECEYRFGAYWYERSDRGKGCDCQRFSENGLDL